MKIIFTIHKDNMFTYFSVEEICNAENIAGEINIIEQVAELLRIFKVFEDNGYNPQISIKE